MGSFTPQQKTVYEGNLHKCPNCGEILNSFMTNCPSCGYEIRDTHGVSSARQLASKLEQIESQRPQKKRSNIFTQYFRGGYQLQSIDEQKINLIKNYAIPNTKEDVLEFIILAAANIDLKVYGSNSENLQFYDPARRELSDAWLAKLEQANQKAEILFGQAPEYIPIQNIYRKKIAAIKKQKRQLVWLLLGLGGMLLICILLPLALVILL